MRSRENTFVRQTTNLLLGFQGSGSRPREATERKGSGDQGNEGGAKRRLDFDPAERRAFDFAGWVLFVFDAADASRRKQGAELWQIARAAAFGAAEESDV